MDLQPVDMLIVGDDPEFRGSLVQHFLRAGAHVEQASGLDAAAEFIEQRQFDVVLVDSSRIGRSGFELLSRLGNLNPAGEFVLLVDQISNDTVAAALKSGAGGVLANPCLSDELELVVNAACERARMKRENRLLKAVLNRMQPTGEMVGNSLAMKELARQLTQAATDDGPLMIEGEPGCGKKFLAHTIHRASNRREKPLLCINCAALSEELQELELFGRRQVGASGVAATLGLFEAADGGAVLFEKIDALSADLQEKCLRVLNERSTSRTGSRCKYRVDVRWYATTTVDLRSQPSARRFSAELLGRIRGAPLKVPSLRDRAGDITVLAEHCLGPDWTIEPAALAALERHAWPDNVRQLFRVIERVKLLAAGRCVRLVDLPSDVAAHESRAEGGSLSATLNIAATAGSANDALSAVQRSHIVEILRRERGNKARTARALGINRRSLYRLLEKHRIDASETSGNTSDTQAS